MKKLMGNTDIEDSLGRLDKLTQEEARMAAAEQLKIAHMVEGKVMGVDERVKEVGSEVQSVSKRVRDVGDRVQGVDDKVQGIDDEVKVVVDRVQAVDDKVQGIDDEVKGVGDIIQAVDNKVQGIDDEVKDVGHSVQGIHGKLDDTNRSSSLGFPTFHSKCSDLFSGNLLRDNLLRWLSPSDPSTNHNIASKARHDGTAQWFFQGGIFNEWKSAGSFLWVHGKRVFILVFNSRY